MIFPLVSRHIDRVFIHCSATDNPNHDDVNVIYDWHVNGNGWSDVGYHFYIKKDGTIQNGRPIDKTPAAQAPYNKATFAICLGGLNDFTDAQFASLRELCYAIDATYKVTFHGHCEVSTKSCPVFDYKEVLGLDEHGNLKKE